MLVGYLIKEGKLTEFRELDHSLQFYRHRAELAGLKPSMFSNGFSVMLKQSVSIIKEVGRAEYENLLSLYNSNRKGK